MKLRAHRMKLRTRPAAAARGQAMSEYISIATILMLGALGAFVAWPFTEALFLSLQTYIDLYFYALNLAIG
jgi:hypothetical protein